MKKPSYEELEVTSYLSGNNASYIEELYEDYLNNPVAVSPAWRQYFESLTHGRERSDISHKEIRQRFIDMAKMPRYMGVSELPETNKQESVDMLIMAYRRFGHLNAKIDPLGSQPPLDVRLTLENYHLSESNFNEKFNTRGLLDNPIATLKEIYDVLRKSYCNTIGVEYSLISNEHEREWLREYVEHRLPNMKFDADTKRSILKKLTAAEGFEKHLEAKYPGQRRFSAEGSESFIPMLDELTKRARSMNVHGVVIGMAHRGRLNVLINIIGQSPLELFQEFEGKKDYGMTSGDVKYHRGFASDVMTTAGPMHLSLAFNPSHLEFINPVVMGSVRARQDRSNVGYKQDYAMSVLIHGDAAFSGQGIVMESLSMSQTRAYNVGGTIHIILNNQVGFTTSDPRDARSSYYCSDIAKMIDAPIFHVNSDDPEAVVSVAQLALDYRMEFHKDIVIDLVCYRKHGHQEVDEPRATQPLMYQVIDNRPSPRLLYARKLQDEGVVTEKDVDEMYNHYRNLLEEGRHVVEVLAPGLSDHFAANWAPYLDKDLYMVADTSVPQKKLLALAKKLEDLPAGFTLQRNVEMIMEARKKMTAGKQPLDWGYSEILAYASLLDEGYSVRLTGEDCRRGTFFHRHACVFDQKTGEAYMPLAHVSDMARVEVYDSLLAEAGPLGFEYGYATSHPTSLVIWEAQYGDFVNGAQVIIDQFLSSGWQKWKRLSGVVLFLPHGNEGSGPEHSSARLERFLQLCAQDNMQVFVPTTPAQMFHLLRRQVVRPCRVPLIVMTPKSLLRHKLSVSSYEDLTHGQLQLMIPEIDDINPSKVTKIVLCCGKIYFELLMQRREQKIDNIALARIEQLYPFPYEELRTLLKSYPNAKQVVWCQEEPKNQGAWFCTRDRLLKCLPKDVELSVVSPRPMAAPAAGYPALYKKTQQEVIDLALK